MRVTRYCDNTVDKQRVNSFVLKHLFWRKLSNSKKSHKNPGNALSDALLMSHFQNFAADAAKKRNSSCKFSVFRAVLINSLICINLGPKILRSCFLQREWVMSHVYNWLVSRTSHVAHMNDSCRAYERVMSPICTSHVASFICATWLVHKWDMTHTYARGMTHSYAWHDSFVCVTWLICMRDMTHSYAWHDSFVCVTWLIRMRDLTRMT